MVKHFPNLVKNKNPHIWKAQQTPRTRNMKKTASKYIIIQLLKTSDKDKILKQPEEIRYIIYRGTKISRTVHFSLEIMQARR